MVSELNFRELVQNVNSIIIRRDIEGRITFANDFALDFFGYKPEELFGQHVVGTIVPPRDSTGRDLAAMIQDISFNPDRYAVNENENMRSNGDRVWVAWTNKAIRDSSGRVAEILCVGNDVTERKRLELIALSQRDLGLALSSATNRAEALRQTLQGALLVARGDCGVIYLHEAVTGTFNIADSIGLTDDFIREMEVRPVASDWSQRVNDGETLFLNAQDINAHKMLSEEKVKALVLVPIRSEDKTVGCLCVGSKKAPLVSPQSGAALKIAADQIAITLKRMQVENKLLREADLWQHTFDAIEDMVALIGEDMRILRANKAMRDFFHDREIIGRHCYALFHQSDRPISACPTLCAFKTHSTTNLEMRERALGNRWFDVRAYPVAGSTGSRMVVHIAHDITKRRIALEELEATIQILRLVNSSGAVADLARCACAFIKEFTECNAVSILLETPPKRRMFEIRGFPPKFQETEVSSTLDAQCFCGKLLRGHFDPSQPGFTQRGSFWTNKAREFFANPDLFSRCIAQECMPPEEQGLVLIPLRAGRDIFGLLRLSDKTGEHFTPERIALIERLAGNLAIGIAQRLVEGERLLFGSAMRHAAESIVITNPQGTIEHVNAAFEAITGYSQAEAVGRPLTFCHSEGEQAENASLLQGETWSGRLQIRRKDGALVEEEANISPVRSATGEIIHYVAVKRNVTREVALEAQFRHAQKMEAVGRLAGGVAHDFNNLLTAIIGYSDVIMERLAPDDPLRNEISQIRKAGDRAASLTRQLLAFSRKQVLQPKMLNLNEVVADIEKMLRRLIGEDIRIEMRYSPEPAIVRADPGQIEQVVMNLALNARDAMPDGGRLIIETAPVTLDAAFIEQHLDAKPGEYIMLAIADTGAGMGKDTLAHVFEPFFTTKAEGKGTGLGLCTVYGIVTQSGGYVTVESEIDKGSCFRIYLPRVESEEPTTESAPARPVHQHGKETILLVEDDLIVRSLTRNILENRGYRVLEASGGNQALLICEHYDQPIDLLLTDVVMPGLRGPDLARKIFQQRNNIKVLFMSGYIGGSAMGDAEAPPADQLLSKPFTPAELTEAVRNALEKGE